MKRVRHFLQFPLIAAMVLLALAAIYNLSPVQQHLGWRVAELMARAKYALRPPARAIFIPQDIVSLPASATRRAKAATPVAGAGGAMVPSATPSGEATLVATPAPLPDSVQLSGFHHEYQTWNNCGPATLAMALSYWGWKGDQRPIAVFTKPNPRDKNVMPDELAQFVQNQSPFLAVTRVGGDKEMLKRFLAAGLPVIIEKGFEGRDFDGWMGHYVLVTGYRDSEQRFTVQDSYYGPNQSIGYSSLESNWRAFDFTYLLVYPATRQAEVAGILGSHMNEGYNDRSAAEKASDEIDILAGRDLFFAWFNRGTNLVRLGDTADAAAAYDEAFRLYPQLPEKQRPWRMVPDGPVSSLLLCRPVPGCHSLGKHHARRHERTSSGGELLLARYGPRGPRRPDSGRPRSKGQPEVPPWVSAGHRRAPEARGCTVDPCLVAVRHSETEQRLA